MKVGWGRWWCRKSKVNKYLGDELIKLIHHYENYNSCHHRLYYCFTNKLSVAGSGETAILRLRLVQLPATDICH
jgi:hypothetical protein